MAKIEGDGVVGSAAACSVLGQSAACPIVEGAPAEQAVLLDVTGVARLLTCSERSIWRLADAGKMPTPVRIGRLVRWQRQGLMDWIAAGCPAVRTVRRGA